MSEQDEFVERLIANWAEEVGVDQYKDRPDSNIRKLARALAKTLFKELDTDQ